MAGTGARVPKQPAALVGQEDEEVEEVDLELDGGIVCREFVRPDPLTRRHRNSCSTL